MLYLAVISLTAAILYFYVGLHAVRANRNSQLCRIFFMLNLCMTIWSFGDAFTYLAETTYEYSFWNKVAAFGWCTFEAVVLYFVLTLVGNRYIRFWFVKLIVMLPAIVCLFMVLFLFGPDVDTKQSVRTFFDIGNFLYNLIYLIVSIVLVFLWGCRSDNAVRRKQAFIISISSIIPFLLNLLVQHVLPALHIVKLPYLGQIFSLIMLLGVYYAITKYQFMSIPSSLITKELFNELTGLTFLTDSQGVIMKANKQAYELLEYRKDEIVGKTLSEVFGHSEINRIMEHCEKLREKVRLEGIDICSKHGNLLQLHISIIPLFIDKKFLGGVLLVGEDIRATRRLEDEIERHRITNGRLKNSEMMFRNILEMAPISIVLARKSTGVVLYMNSWAEKLFGTNTTDMVGSNVSKLLVHSEDELLLTESFLTEEYVSNREIQMTKNDGTIFTGLITIIPSIYYEEKVALSCIIDITEQKKVEEKLIQNNEYINELNKELLQMNASLMNKSIKDGLTNLYNHQYINEVLADCLRKLPVDVDNLCLMMVDIDHFKKVNDKYGHQVGDMVLQTVSDFIIENITEEDMAGRYGGEEFIVILPHTELEAAITIAESIRLAVYRHDYGIDDMVVSISLGVAEYENETLSSFINKADMLLYQAKAKGRNRVESILAPMAN